MRRPAKLPAAGAKPGRRAAGLLAAAGLALGAGRPGDGQAGAAETEKEAMARSAAVQEMLRRSRERKAEYDRARYEGYYARNAQPGRTAAISGSGVQTGQPPPQAR